MDDRVCGGTILAVGFVRIFAAEPEAGKEVKRNCSRVGRAIVFGLGHLLV